MLTIEPPPRALHVLGSLARDHEAADQIDLEHPAEQLDAGLEAGTSRPMPAELTTPVMGPNSASHGRDRRG